MEMIRGQEWGGMDRIRYGSRRPLTPDTRPLLPRRLLFDGLRHVDLVAAGALGSVLAAIDGVDKRIDAVSIVSAGRDTHAQGDRGGDALAHPRRPAFRPA